LTDDGQLKLILPTGLADIEIAPILSHYKLYVQTEMAISSFAEEPPIRKIWGIGKKVVPLEKHTFDIYAARGVYTEAYKKLLQPLYLASSIDVSWSDLRYASCCSWSRFRIFRQIRRNSVSVTSCFSGCNRCMISLSTLKTSLG